MTATMAPTHTPVMVTEVVAAILPSLAHPGAVMVDATVGLGGHSAALLEASQCRLIGIDHDGEALAVAAARLARFQQRVDLVRARFDALPDVLDELGIGQVSAVFFDLGLSSLQIDRDERGFTYSKDAPLDMRMDDRLTFSAADLVNTWPAADLARVLRDFGDEPHANRVAQAIVDARAAGPILTTGHLVQVVTDAMPAAVRFGPGGHPAKRVFQALRIAVNDELTALRAALPAALDRVRVGGRVAALAYHSGEDRIVKQAFRAVTRVAAPRRLPVVPGHLEPRFRDEVDAARPSSAEIAANARSASARLRVVARIKESR